MHPDGIILLGSGLENVSENDRKNEWKLYEKKKLVKIYIPGLHLQSLQFSRSRTGPVGLHFHLVSGGGVLPTHDPHSDIPHYCFAHVQKKG